MSIGCIVWVLAANILAVDILPGRMIVDLAIAAHLTLVAWGSVLIEPISWWHLECIALGLLISQLVALILLVLVVLSVEVLLMRLRVRVLCAFDVHWGALPDSLVAQLTSCRWSTCTTVSTTRFELQHLLLTLLAKFLQVDFHDVLDYSMHLSFVLHNLCDVDDFLALKICEEIAEALHDLLIAAFILKLWLSHAQFSSCAIQCLIFLLVLLYVDVFA